MHLLLKSGFKPVIYDPGMSPSMQCLKYLQHYYALLSLMKNAKGCPTPLPDFVCITQSFNIHNSSFAFSVSKS